MFAFYTKDIDRAEVLCVEDLPKDANFCPRKQPEKELEASSTTVCAG